MYTHCAAAYPHHMTDIYSSSARMPKEKKKGASRVKKAMLIAAVSLTSAAVLGGAGWTLLHFFGNAVPQANNATAYPSGTTVAGLDISGKTYEEAKAFLAAHEGDFIRPVTVNVEIAGATETLTQENFSYSYDIDSALSQAGVAESKSADITATVKDASVVQAANAIAAKYQTEPQNASVAAFHPFADERFEITESRDGLAVNADDLTAKITEALKSGDENCSVSAETESIPADVTTETLRNSMVQLGAYQTYTTTDSQDRINATHNMEVALNACNQHNEILPGETWSFNECTGDSNLESNGYVAATVITNGQYADGVGGGICQASSTIYNAALKANLKVVERAPHKWASSYVPTGLDATIDYGYIDLQLQNTSDTPVYIECRLVDNTLYAAFWGAKSSGFDEIVLKNQDGGDDADGEGYSVTAWREYYKDGELVGEEALPGSHYDIDGGHGHSFYSVNA